jgi:pyrroloquinoline-quinone synthase
MQTAELDAIVAHHDLNQHPFYRAWRAGALPREALARYATEYAPFIEAIGRGWRTLGENTHADIESGHADLWRRFREELDAPGHTSCAQAVALVAHAHRAFAHPDSAIGALYAFEAQQPSTARSKLDGLRERYALTEAGMAYFRHHADDYRERDELRARLAALSPSSLATAQEACEAMCRAMWSALDGVMAMDPCQVS